MEALRYQSQLLAKQVKLAEVETEHALDKARLVEAETINSMLKEQVSAGLNKGRGSHVAGPSDSCVALLQNKGTGRQQWQHPWHCVSCQLCGACWPSSARSSPAVPVCLLARAACGDHRVATGGH